MALQDQIATTPLAYDEVFFNYSTTTDIAAYTVVAIDTTNYVNDGTHYAPGVILPATGGNPTLSLGITQEIIKFGQSGRVRTLGLSYCTANGTITVGGTVDADVTTAGRILAHVAGKASLGQARSGGASGDTVLVFVCPSLNA